MTYLTPDLDALVASALRAADLGATVVVNRPPGTIAEHVPLVVARQTPGGSATTHRSVTGLVNVQVFAADRREASQLARSVVAALVDAARDRFSTPDGYLNRVSTPGGAPVELPDADRDSAYYRFSVSCRVSARSNL